MQKAESPILTERCLDPWKAANQQLQMARRIMPDSRMPRWLEALQEPGPIEVDLSFDWGEQKRIRVQGSISAQGKLQCQRCLGDMPLSLTVDVDAAVVFSEEAAAQLPAELDPWMGEGEQLDLLQQIEDELLLALPMMPVHEQESCPGESHYSTGGNTQKSTGKKAFAQLADLVKKTNN